MISQTADGTPNQSGVSGHFGHFPGKLRNEKEENSCRTTLIPTKDSLRGPVHTPWPHWCSGMHMDAVSDEVGKGTEENLNKTK